MAKHNVFVFESDLKPRHISNLSTGTVVITTHDGKIFVRKSALKSLIKVLTDSL